MLVDWGRSEELHLFLLMKKTTGSSATFILFKAAERKNDGSRQAGTVGSSRSIIPNWLYCQLR